MNKCECKDPKPVRLTEEVFTISPRPAIWRRPTEAVMCDRCGGIITDWHPVEAV